MERSATRGNIGGFPMLPRRGRGFAFRCCRWSQACVLSWEKTAWRSSWENVPGIETPSPLSGRGRRERNLVPRVARRRAAPRRRFTRGYNPRPRWGQKPRRSSPRSHVGLRPEGGRNVATSEAQRNSWTRWRFSDSCPGGAEDFSALTQAPTRCGGCWFETSEPASCPTYRFARCFVITTNHQMC